MVIRMMVRKDLHRREGLLQKTNYLYPEGCFLILNSQSP